jgi:hypothetical protein
MMAMYHIQTWKLCYTAKHHLLLQSIVSGFRKHNLLVAFLSVQLLTSLSLDALN